MRSSNWPRLLGPGHHEGEVERDDLLVHEDLGHDAVWRSRRRGPPTMAVLPTPASPISTGLFLVRRQRRMLHDALDLGVAPEAIGVELALFGELGRGCAPNWCRASWACCLPFAASGGLSAAAGAVPRACADDLSCGSCAGSALEVEQDARRDALVFAGSEPQQDVLGPMPLWPSERASRSASSRTFLARGVKGACPVGDLLAGAHDADDGGASLLRRRIFERRRAGPARGEHPLLRAAGRAGGARCRCSCASDALALFLGQHDEACRAPLRLKRSNISPPQANAVAVRSRRSPIRERATPAPPSASPPIGPRSHFL